MIVGCGIDMIEVYRIAKVTNDAFLKRLFTSAERDYFQSRQMNHQVVAGNFAAKEAVAKALGLGFGLMQWREIEVLRDQRGRPYALLSGQAQARMEELGAKHVHVSISNLKEYAIAQAIVEQ